MNNLDEEYKELLKIIIHHGVDKDDRTGTGTKSIFGYQIRHRMGMGFPLLTTKKMAWKTMVTELLWFLRGDTNIKFLVDNGCNIWNGDAYKHYMKVYEIESRETQGGKYLEELHMLSDLSMDEFVERIKTDDEFADRWGELGPIYGNQWRNWGGYGDVKNGIDQIQNLINELKTNPASRRLLVNAWNVGELYAMVLPPCHYGFQMFVRPLTKFQRMDYYQYNLPEEDRDWDMPFEKLDELGVPTNALSLMWNQRSVDTFLGLPFNIASYGLLLEIIALEVGMIPDLLIGNLGDTHLYNNHQDAAFEQMKRESFELPKLRIKNKKPFDQYTVEDFELIDYKSHPSIKAPLSN